MVRRLVLVWLVMSAVATLPAQQNTGAPVVPDHLLEVVECGVEEVR